MESWRKEDFAWAAGFFEGEGCIGIRVGKRRSGNIITLECRVGQVEVEPLNKLLAMFGGTLKRLNRPPGKNYRPIFLWTIVCQRAAEFLRKIEPHIVRPTVRERIVVATSFQEQKQILGRQDQTEYRTRQMDFYERMKRLNHRGLGN